MSVCQTTPTATQFATVTTDSVSTSTSQSVTTIPADITTITTSSCLATSSGVSVSCNPTTIVSTISPEQTVTTQVPFVVSFPVTLTTPTATLFATSCSQGGGGDSSTISSTTSLPPTSTSSSTSISTLPPTTSESVVQSSSTLANGSIIVVSSTVTTVVTPTTTVSASNSGSSTNVGAIVGGTVGGVAFLAALLLAVYFCIRKRHKNRDDDFDNIDGKINPFPIRLHKGPAKRTEGMTIDEPDPSANAGTTSNNFASNIAPEAAGMAGVGAGAVATGVASGAGSIGPRRPPSTTTGSFPNPYDTVPSTGGGSQRSGAPPAAPISDGTVISDSIYSQQSRVPLHVANPSDYPPIPPMPIASTQQPPIRMPVPFAEESGPSVYGSVSDGSGTDPRAGTSAAPFVHHDAGPIRSNKVEEARTDAGEQHDAGEVPPPAYEA
ncbi:hypothetical protein BDY19DRAFT_357926 [Irpex rosettiformis]|uniref:Uncharacterized protein n=1 Tax=Irpex rosettiformis TaxID=378272 RepID=A0ACB8TWR4_9APHY|nr:hypothetical protein BDY19DRAFT_357926 [Irpex rosettiformis]